MKKRMLAMMLAVCLVTGSVLSDEAMQTVLAAERAESMETEESEKNIVQDTEDVWVEEATEYEETAGELNLSETTVFPEEEDSETVSGTEETETAVTEVDEVEETEAEETETEEGETEELEAENEFRTTDIEDNDIWVNTEYVGQLSSWNDEKWYKFSLPRAGKVSMTFSHTNLQDKGRYWVLGIYNADMVRLAYLDSEGTVVRKTSAEIGLTAGEYWVRVMSDAGWRGHNYSYYNSSTSEYVIKVNYTASDYWEKENNDTYQEATPISLNKEYYGANQFWDEVDYYKFSLARAGKVSVDFKHENLMDTGRFWVIRLFDAYTNELVYKGISGTETKGSSAEVGLAPGTYYVRINTDDNERSCDNSSTVTYSLKVNYQASEFWEREGNNDYYSADKILIGKSYYGANQYWNDVDYYKFTLGSAGRIKINFRHENLKDAGRFWCVRIYNEKTEEVMYLGATGTNTNITSEAVKLPAGSYYVRINTDDNESYYSNWSWATYNFQVQYEYFTGGPALKATATSCDKIDLLWKRLSGANGYEVYRATSKNGTYKKIKTVNGATKYADTHIVPGKNYYYKIRAYKKVSGKSHYSPYSLCVKAKAQPKQVTGTRVKAGKQRATVTWKKQKGINGYEVWMSARKGSGYRKVKTCTKASATKYIKTGLKKGKNYYFKVRSYKTVKGKKVYGDYGTPKVVKIKK